MKETKGCVYLVGAGCGAADLITVRGRRLLRRCDAVVYDDLISAALLAEVPAAAERLYVGKRSGRHSLPQADINALLLQKAGEGKTVVRLKGGDPFVFGRGGEEMLALQGAGIPCEEVPGISSAIAIPAAAGIPVTHRGLSQSLHLITGHTADTADGLPHELERLARLEGTLVFLMGFAQLRRIAAGLVAAGRAPETPAAVISGGNAANPATVRGTLHTIADLAAASAIASPAVIVVGEVAALSLGSTLAKPLTGVRIGLTGTRAVTDKLRVSLEELGAEALLAEKSRVEALPLDFDLATLCDGRRRWIVLTSSNGVRLFFAALAAKKIDLRRLHTCRFAVIGAATGETLAQYGVFAELCPEVYTSEGLAAALCPLVELGEEVLLFRSAHGSPVLTAALTQRNLPHQDIPIYDLHAEERTAEEIRPRLKALDYLTFSSASGVTLFFKTQGAIPPDAVCVCIGEVTARALQKRYDKPFLTAGEISAAGIAEAILRHKRG